MPLEEEVPAVGPPSAEEGGIGAPSRVITAPTPSPKPIGFGPSKQRLLD